MPDVHHRYATVNGHRLFYREAGPRQAPVILLLHGFPTSSHMYRNLVPRLAERYRVIAPDMLGFGLSDAPSTENFTYTFEALADLTAALLRHLGVPRFAVYVQDYGAPIGWRLALRDPRALTAVVTQNGNAYEAGFYDSPWTRRAQAYGQDPSPSTEAAVRQAFTLADIRWQYVTGAPEESLVSPDTWHHDHALVARPGNDEIQLALFRDYGTNVVLYPAVQEYLRTSGVPLLAVWGDGDQIFGPDGARAFTSDARDAEVELLPGGHFLLETAGEQVADLVLSFLDRRLPSTDEPVGPR